VDLELTNKIVLVTGGSRGIGRAIVTRFAEEGAQVITTYRDGAAAAEDLCGGLKSRSLSARAVKCDARDVQSVTALIDMIGAEHGGLDVLVNNAGIIRDGLTMTMEDADWDAVIGTNLTGIFNAIRPASRLMMRARKGSIVNLSSIAASRPGKGHANYAAAKGGVEAMTRALAQELASRKVRVNAVAPGMIETDMSQEVRDRGSDLLLDRIALKRFGQPGDIADAVLFLASERSSYITGQILSVDGGWN